VTCMKAVRSLLALNMDLARDGLVSKSDVENETYLFKAACSELRTEIQNKRRQEVEQMRTQRTQLQHEVEILNQRMGQETSAMKEELKGMFDDRKMSVRMEQKAMESTVSISIMLRHHTAAMLTNLLYHRYNNSITKSPWRSTPIPAPRWRVSAGSSPVVPAWRL
jgi:rhamnogalacturonyl hydrolase YesR